MEPLANKFESTLHIHIIKKESISLQLEDVTLSPLFVLRSQLGQDLLIAGLPAGDLVKVSAGIFADRHTLSSKCPADVAEVTLMLCCGVFVFFQQFCNILLSCI